MLDGLEGLQVIIEVAPPDLVLAHEDAIRPVHAYILGVQVRERDRVRRDETKSHDFSSASAGILRRRRVERLAVVGRAVAYI